VLFLNALEETGLKGGVHVDSSELGESGSDSEGTENEEDRNGDALEPNWSVMDVWSMRLWPLWAKDVDSTGAEPQGARRSAEAMQTKEQQECAVLECNRFGHERGTSMAVHLCVVIHLIVQSRFRTSWFRVICCIRLVRIFVKTSQGQPDLIMAGQENESLTSDYFQSMV
jgi:hypothetical protein